MLCKVLHQDLMPLLVDSLNQYGFDTPVDSDEVEAIEDDPDEPGKIILVNDGDVDLDGIPDYADGYDLFSDNPDDDTSSGVVFVPVVFEIPEPVNVTTAVVRISYPASDPGAVITNGLGGYTLPPGKLRLWARDGSEQRSTNFVWRIDAPGDYLPPTTSAGIPAAELGFTNGVRSVTFYAEATRPSEETADIRILFEVKPDERTGFIAVDAVRATVIKIDVAMDGNRDDTIDFNDAKDEEYLFWVNDDNDVRHYTQTELMWHEDDQQGDADCDDDYIGNNTQIGQNSCKRDLEDFTRLHLFVDDNATTLSGITYHLKFENVTGGSPSINIFEAVNAFLSYVNDSSASEAQIQKKRLITVGSSEVVLDAAYIVKGDQRSPFLLEGKSAGKGDLTFIVKKDGKEVCRQSVELELKPIAEFYNKYVVTTNMDDNVNPTSSEVGTCTYLPSVDEYVLFVHGWNVDAWLKDRWAETVFKRLWWQGYKGHVGCFQWPTLGTLYYDRSEIRAWNSSEALKHRINTLNFSYSGEVRIIAHSMGNVVVGETLRLFSSSLVHSYIAAQAALPGHCYDNTITNYWTGFTTPNVYGFYYSGGAPSFPYFNGNSSKAGNIFRYYNAMDWALDWWETSNEMKPDFNYHYTEGDSNVDTYNPSVGDRFYYNSILPLDEHDLVFFVDRYEIFARCAESRSRALGAISAPMTGFSIERDLQGTGMGYDDAHYSHSREFRSNIIDEWQFWTYVKNDFALTAN